MKIPRNQILFSDIMKVRKSNFRKEKFESNHEEKVEVQNDPLAFQLPTVIVSGAKKCGTKTLMRFFGHHPQARLPTPLLRFLYIFLIDISIFDRNLDL